MSNQTSSPLTSDLSVELQQIILSHIPDIYSLHSAALSCRALYDAFLSREASITTDVLVNQIGEDVIPEAAINQRVLFWDHCECHFKELMNPELAQRKVKISESWNLRDAILMARLHNTVSELTEQFLRHVAQSPYFGTRPVSRAEIARVQRAMYQFEIFCNIFRPLPDDDHSSSAMSQGSDDYMKKFQPQETEQLVCVHDFFCDIIHPAMREIADHDVTWGKHEIKIEWWQRKWDGHIQYILSLGLERIAQVSKAETYDIRHALLYSGEEPKARFSFLNMGLAIAHANASNRDFLYQTVPQQDPSLPKGRAPFFDDEDTGPFDIWLWLYAFDSVPNCLEEDKLYLVRQWGYVMWDRARHDESGIWNEDIDAMVERSLDEESEEEVKMRGSIERRKPSWEARARIYEAGGRGWWEMGDHSKIVWLTSDLSSLKTEGSRDKEENLSEK